MTTRPNAVLPAKQAGSRKRGGKLSGNYYPRSAAKCRTNRCAARTDPGKPPHTKLGGQVTGVHPTNLFVSVRFLLERIRKSGLDGGKWDELSLPSPVLGLLS